MFGWSSNKWTKKLRTFRHGVHPEEHKDLSNRKLIERMPFVKEYTLPLMQHIGAPSKPVVRKGQYVRRGELIAEADGFVSVALHAPVDGTVTAIDLFDHPNGEMLPAIRIKTDPFSTQELAQPIPTSPEELDSETFIKMIQGAGIVGLGGAAFPSHVKFKIPADRSCQYLMLNGCECEPFLTCDHRVMVEYAEALIDGVAILQQFIKAEKVYIAIEANKPDAMAMLEEAAAGKYPVEIVPLQVKYPQGAEKMMVSAILGKEVPSGKLPIDLGVLVANVGTIVAISDYFRKGKPLIERVITVTGPGVERPANVLVPIGTPIIEVVDFCGGINAEKIRILLGGPMMGVVQKSLDAPVLKGTSGILVLNDEALKPAKTFPCINCGHCVDACPMLLNPARLGELSKHNQWAAMKEHHALDCFECGACAYVCPSHIPLVQRIKVGKGMIKQLSR